MLCLRLGRRGVERLQHREDMKRERPLTSNLPKVKRPDETLGERCLRAKGARRAALLADERRHTPRWHFLSFADERGFRGGAIVWSYGFLTAIQRATDLGINPGGEVLCTPIPRRDLVRISSDLRNRLLSEDQIRNQLEGDSVL